MLVLLIKDGCLARIILTLEKYTSQLHMEPTQPITSPQSHPLSIMTLILSLDLDVLLEMQVECYKVSLLFQGLCTQFILLKEFKQVRQ